jgi:hypothetical protein
LSFVAKLESANNTVEGFILFMGKSSVDGHYKGHTIRVSAVRIPQIDRWTVRSFVSWNFANDSGEETIVRTDLEFGTVEKAMQAGVESAIKWIDEGKPPEQPSFAESC